MLIGASQVNITPETPFPIQGHYYLRMGKKILDPLYASSVVLDNGHKEVVIISCDVAEIMAEDVSIIRKKINEETGIKASNIIISATHTHQGPIMSNKNKEILAWCVRDEKQHDFLLERISKSAIAAFHNKKSACIGYGKGKVKRCGFNRRYIMSNGKSKMNPFGVNNPDRLIVEGPVDREVQVTWFEDKSGNHLVIMVNFSSHPVTLIGTEYVSADFPGAMRKNIQNIFGSDIPVVYLQGACGNIDTYDFENDDDWGKDIEGYTRIGRILAGEVIKIISQDYAKKKEVQISIKNQILQVPYKEICREEVAQIRKQWDQMSEEEKEKMPFDEKVHSVKTMHLDSLKMKNETHPIEISVLKMDDIIIATNPGEYFVEYQLELKKKFKDKKIMLMELANGGVGYIPTKQAIALGGYEAESTMFNNEAGSMIVDGWVNLIKQI